MHPQRDVAFECYAAGLTTKEVAAKTGVSERTLWSWKYEPEFAERLRARAKETVDEIRDSLPNLGQMALDTFKRALSGGEVSTVAYKAAADILRSLGVIGEQRVALTKETDDVKFIEIGSDAEGNPVRLDKPDEPICNAGPETGN